VSKLRNSTHGSGWKVQVQPTNTGDRVLESTHGSGWIIQIPLAVFESQREKAGLEASTHFPWVGFQEMCARI